MNAKEKLIEKLILLTAVTSVVSVVLITIFVFSRGVPVILKEGVFNFAFGSSWAPTSGTFEILPLIGGSLAVTLIALLIGVPVGIGSAVFLAEIAGKKASGILRAAIDLLAGIPSVVYGFFGLVVLVPAIRNFIVPIVQRNDPNIPTTGFSILAGGIILAIMILPTIVSISTNSIEAVPGDVREGSLALGADKRETVMKVILPGAKSGICASIILGMGRAIGETMAVLMITGNVAILPKSLLDPVATMTGTIAMEMSYASPTHKDALFAVGVILFVIIIMLNMFAQFIMKKFDKAGA